MNIFILEHRLPSESLADWCYRIGQSHCDQHNKLVLEAWQQLNTCANVIGIKTDNKSVAYKNHPCTLFTRGSLGSWQFVIEYARGVALSMLERGHSKKLHASLERIEDNIPEDANGRLVGERITDFALAMPDWIKRKHGNAVDAYREYYCLHKSWFARKVRGVEGKYTVYPSTWKNSEPDWFERICILEALDKGYVSAWQGSKRIVLSRDMVVNLEEFL